jgi:L-fuconolactonase
MGEICAAWDMDLIFDSHAHLIADDNVRYPPAPLSGALRPGDLEDPMTAEKLVREMDVNGVEIAAAVQRGHIYGFDNNYVCDAAAMYPKRLLAVCSIDGRNTDCGSQVRHWVRRGAVGIRMMEPFKGADPSWFAGETAHPIWTAAADLDVPVCVHFFRWNRAAGLPALHAVLEEFPRTAVVLDHFSNMRSEAGAPNHGLDDLLLRMADLPRVCTKFTTIPLGQLKEDGIDAAPVVKRVVQAFGERRVMWGSDIAQSKGTYESMVQLAREATRLLTETERRWVLHDAACSVYLDGA